MTWPVHLSCARFKRVCTLCIPTLFRTSVNGILSCHLIFRSFLRQLKWRMVKPFGMALVHCPGAFSSPVTISPCLIRFVPESARNHAGTDETVPLPLAARARTHTGHQMPQRRKKHMPRPGLEPRTSRRPWEHSDHWATRSTCDNFPLLN